MDRQGAIQPLMPGDTYGLVTVIVLFCEALERVASIAAYYFTKTSRNEKRGDSRAEVVRCSYRLTLLAEARAGLPLA